VTDPGNTGLPAGLVATKLHAPALRRELVERTRLLERLEVPALPTLTIVSAPAGFGKSTLLAAWSARTRAAGHEVTWLSLDVRDNDLTLFQSYVIAALASIDATIGIDARRLLESSESAHVVLGSVVNDLMTVTGEAVVVLDDYHVIDSPLVHEAVAFMVENLPSHVHLVVAGRADPPLPLGRLRARGELVEIRAADLRFTSAEAARYLNDSMHLELTAGDVDALEARTEGWIAALQLAAISMQGRTDASEFIATFAGDDRFVVDFLAEEVLERLPPDDREFLLDTATLDRFTAEACNALTGRSDGAAMLDRLDRANLFLVPLDDRRRWYRYHHLFADVLRARLLAQNPDRVVEMHRRASIWCEREGDHGSAIAHAFVSRDQERAADLIEAAAPALRRARQDETLRAWLEALPEAVFVDRPRLAMDLVGARVVTHDPSGVASLLATVEEHLEREPSEGGRLDQEQLDGLRAEVLVHRAGLMMLAGDHHAALPLGRAVLSLVHRGDDRLRGVANGLLGIGHWATGELETAEARYADAVDAFTASEHLADMLGCSLAMGDIQIALGRLSDAQRTFEAGLRTTTEHLGLRGAADMHVGLSEVLIERNELDAADEHLTASLALGPSGGLPQHPYRWRVTMARLCRARGELAPALGLLAEAAPLYETDFSPPVRPVAALEARVRLACGDLPAALRWAQDQGLRADDALGYIREFEHITLARTLIARHERDRDPSTLDEVLGLLDRLHGAAEAGHRNGSLIEITILQAAALHAADRLDEAARSLERAVSLATHEGHVRLFLHAGPAVIALLRAMDGPLEAMPSLRAALGSAGPDPRTASPPGQSHEILVDELSARELEVLRMLRTDLSGPDIASQLFVSLNTLRTHTRNIYVKLGVNNRREAVSRAADLGL
jgi:LuxR family transcriptional regulator, maltose regulon positive regulatory protein